MSGWSRDTWTKEICKPCAASGQEEHLWQFVNDEPGGMSCLIVHCRRCGWSETRAAAVGVHVRSELLKARKRASVRAWTWMAIGAVVTLGAIGLVAASALAALH